MTGVRVGPPWTFPTVLFSLVTFASSVRLGSLTNWYLMISLRRRVVLLYIPSSPTCLYFYRLTKQLVVRCGSSG